MRCARSCVVLLIACLASPALADSTEPECPDLPAYRNAVFLHQRWQKTACLDDGSADCAQENAAIAQLSQLMAACEAGRMVGPPPTHFDVPAAVLHRRRTTGLLEGLAGGGLALASSDWSKSVKASPSLAARVGGMRGWVGAMLSTSFTRERLADPSVVLPFGTTERTFNRFRVLVDGVVERHPIPGLAIDGFVGIGVDVALVSFQHYVAGQPANDDASDTGLALELGASGWWRVGEDVEVGGSLVVPYAHHSSAGQTGMASFSYSGADLDLLLGVRVSTP